MKLLLTTAFCLLTLFSWSQTDFNVLHKDHYEHYGIIEKEGFEALYDFRADTFVTPLSNAKALHLDSSFYLVFDHESKTFRLYYMRGTIVIGSRPKRELTAYYSDAGSIGISGQLISFDNVACHGSDAFQVSHWYSWGSSEFEFYPRAKCLNFQTEGYYQTPILRATMLTDQTLLVERAIHTQANFQTYNFKTNSWTRQQKAVLIKRPEGYDMVSFKLDSVEENYYGDIWWEHIQAPHKMRRIVFSDEKGYSLRAPYSMSKEVFDDSIHAASVHSDYLLPRRKYHHSRHYNATGRGARKTRIDSIKRDFEVVFYPDQPLHPIIYWDQDTLFAEFHRWWRSRIGKEGILSAQWDPWFGWKNDRTYKTPTFKFELTEDSILKLIYRAEPDITIIRTKYKNDTVHFKEHGPLHYSGIYDMTTHLWIIPAEMEDVQLVEGHQLALKEGILSIFKNGQLIMKSTQAPNFPDGYAYLLGLDSIVPFTPGLAWCYGTEGRAIAEITGVGKLTLPTYKIISYPPDDCIPLIGMNAGSFMTVRDSVKTYHIYASPKLQTSGRETHSNVFTYKTKAAFSGFRQVSHPDLHTGLAHDAAPPALGDLVYFTEGYSRDLDDFNSLMPFSFHDLGNGVAEVHNKSYFMAMQQPAMETMGYFDYPTSRYFKPGDRLPPSNTYQSGYYDFHQHQWLIPPRYASFIQRYNGITAVAYGNWPEDTLTTYADYSPDLTLREIVRSNHLDSIGKAYLTYPTYRVDSILRRENAFTTLQGDYTLSKVYLYQTGKQFGTMLYKNKWIISPPADAVIELGPSYLLYLHGDSLTIGAVTFPLEKMEIKVRRSSYSQSLEFYIGSDTLFYRSYTDSLTTDGSIRSYYDVCTHAFIDKEFIAVCASPITYTHEDRFGTKYRDVFRQPTTATQNCSSLWVKEADAWKNKIGFRSNLERLPFGYFNGSEYVKYPDNPVQNTSIRSPGRFFTLSGVEDPELSKLSIFHLEKVDDTYLGYAPDKLHILDEFGSLIRSNDYQVFKTKGDQIFLPKYDASGHVIMENGEPVGRWVQMPR